MNPDREVARRVAERAPIGRRRATHANQRLAGRVEQQLGELCVGTPPRVRVVRGGRQAWQDRLEAGVVEGVGELFEQWSEFGIDRFVVHDAPLWSIGGSVASPSSSDFIFCRQRLRDGPSEPIGRPSRSLATSYGTGGSASTSTVMIS